MREQWKSYEQLKYDAQKNFNYSMKTKVMILIWASKDLNTTEVKIGVLILATSWKNSFWPKIYLNILIMVHDFIDLYKKQWAKEINIFSFMEVFKKKNMSWMKARDFSVKYFTRIAI